jgi:hypothetical protein
MTFLLSDTRLDTCSTIQGSRICLHAYEIRWNIFSMRTNHIGQLGPGCKR